MSPIDALSVCLGHRAGVHSGIDAPLPAAAAAQRSCDSCICTVPSDGKNLAADGEPAGTAARRACFGRGFGELGWRERKTYLSHAEFSMEAKHPWDSFGSVFVEKKHSNSSWPGSVNIAVVGSQSPHAGTQITARDALSSARFRSEIELCRREQRMQPVGITLHSDPSSPLRADSPSAGLLWQEDSGHVVSE
ncbi:hypothetical protein EYF80_042267 [Liparis tanakae]|uniref:Uncharacterized protein n=1 Tax=Liparis tanakae TaxID=230148 RepID=A0A4Z2G1W3_9TELE|nr:hypothetical protein EYF80_042267 [Liparis tanakae]